MPFSMFNQLKKKDLLTLLHALPLLYRFGRSPSYHPLYYRDSILVTSIEL